MNADDDDEDDIMGSQNLPHQTLVERLEERLEEEGRLLEELPQLPDLQCAWALLLHTAVPRANHLLRMLPPSLSMGYAEHHDDLIRKCLSSCLEHHDNRTA